MYFLKLITNLILRHIIRLEGIYPIFISNTEDEKMSCRRRCRRVYGNTNGVQGANVQCNRYNNRRYNPTSDVLDDAFNQGYNKGYCDGVEAGREEGFCEGYEQGAVEGCQNAKQRALNCINDIDC